MKYCILEMMDIFHHDASTISLPKQGLKKNNISRHADRDGDGDRRNLVAHHSTYETLDIRRNSTSGNEITAHHSVCQVPRQKVVYKRKPAFETMPMNSRQ